MFGTSEGQHSLLGKEGTAKCEQEGLRRRTTGVLATYVLALGCLTTHFCFEIATKMRLNKLMLIDMMDE